MKTKIMFKHVVVGGVFDHLHKGHKALLDKAFSLGEKVTVGLAAEKLTKNKFLSETIQSYSARRQALKKYWSLTGSCDRNQILKVLKIDDIFGSTLTDKTIEAIIVSRETLANATLINKERKKRDLPPLEIILVPDVLADDGELISSQKIRLGVIDREGSSYQLKKLLILPEYLRESLRHPLGKVVSGSESQLESTAKKAVQLFKQLNPLMVIAVGDIVSASLESVGFFPDVKIIDYRSRRKKFSNFQFQIFNKVINPRSRISKKIVNKPGTISKEAIKIINRSIVGYLTANKKQTVVINGEEDLLALPAILFAPLGSLILYGHWQYGVIAVEVTEKTKAKIVKIINKFD